MAYETLEVERRGPVGWLVFNRPDSGNALNATMFAELERAWLELDADPDVRVIVNAGNGRSFQTGVDVVQMSRDLPALRQFSRQTRATSSSGSRRGSSVCASRSSPRSTASARAAACTSSRTPTSRSSPRTPSCAIPHVSVGQVERVRDDRAGPQVTDGSGPADGAHRTLRADERRTRVPARHRQPGRRAAGAAPRRGAAPGRADRRGTRRPR